MVLPGEAGFSPDGEVDALFFAEPVRIGDGYEKGEEKVMLHRGERMAVNFGLLWGRAGAGIFLGALARLHRNTRGPRCLRTAELRLSEPATQDLLELHIRLAIVVSQPPVGCTLLDFVRQKALGTSSQH